MKPGDGRGQRFVFTSRLFTAAVALRPQPLSQLFSNVEIRRPVQLPFAGAQVRFNRRCLLPQFALPRLFRQNAAAGPARNQIGRDAADRNRCDPAQCGVYLKGLGRPAHFAENPRLAQ